MTTWTMKGSIGRVLVLGMALAPVALLAQQATAPDAQGTTQGQGPEHGRRGGGPAERQAHMLKKLTKRLDLTPDQVSQVQGVQDDSRTQLQALRSDTSAPADRHTKMMEIHKTEQEKIRAVLNDQQKTKFDAMVARRQERRHEHDASGQNPPA